MEAIVQNGPEVSLSVFRNGEDDQLCIQWVKCASDGVEVWLHLKSADPLEFKSLISVFLENVNFLWFVPFQGNVISYLDSCSFGYLYVQKFHIQLQANMCFFFFFF